MENNKCKAKVQLGMAALQDTVDNLSDLSDIDSEDNEDLVFNRDVSPPDSFVIPDQDLLIEQRLAQIFGSEEIHSPTNNTTPSFLVSDDNLQELLGPVGSPTHSQSNKICHSTNILCNVPGTHSPQIAEKEGIIHQSSQQTSAETSTKGNISIEFSSKLRTSIPRQWKLCKKVPVIPKFEKSLQPTSHYTHKTPPIDMFDNFFPPTVVQQIVEETNRYAIQSQSKCWVDVTIHEIRAYLGVLILMGLNPLPDIELYWSSDPFYNNREISNIFTLTRFRKITENLHLTDNTKMPARGNPDYDKLFKLRPLITCLNTVFQALAYNSSVQSIDESMVKLKGRSSLKQYMPQKPIKRGYKMWARCDAKSGYLYQFEIYTGKGDNMENEGLGYNVVWKLCSDLPRNTLVAFNNFFTSCNLMQDLYHKGIYAVGTVRTNRKDLPDIFKKLQPKQMRLQKHEFATQSSGPITALKWMDTRYVTVLTTAHQPREVTFVKRTQKDGSRKEVLCPQAVATYTLSMGGVDRFDHFRSSYPINRKSRKFWMRLFLFMFDSAIINAYITYCTLHKYTRHPHREFRLRVARGLIDGFSGKIYKVILFKNKKGGNFGVPDEIRLSNVGVHFPEGIVGYKRCRFCSTKSAEKRSNIQCSKCNVALCVKGCFKSFHLVDAQNQKQIEI